MKNEEKIFCCYCGKELVHSMEVTKEHLIPKSHGGNGSSRNVKACCSNCNSARGNQPLESWILSMKLVLIELKDKGHAKGPLAYTLSMRIENAEYWLQYIRTEGKKLYLPSRQPATS